MVTRAMLPILKPMASPKRRATCSCKSSIRGGLAPFAMLSITRAMEVTGRSVMPQAR